jgi:DNA-binding MarR family transcriptional regulator
MGKQTGGLTMLEGMVLDMTAEGKTPRQIGEALGVTPSEAAKMAYDLLDREIVTDTEQRRKLQVYRLEKIVEALWQRTMQNAHRDDVKNLVDVLDKLNTLLALNKEVDAEVYTRMHQHQFQAYLNALMALIVSFKMLAPDLMTEDQWAAWAAGQLEESKNLLAIES